jgi:hypothetical protein
MPNNLPALTGGLLPAKLDRQVARALQQIDASAAVARRSDQLRIQRVAEATASGLIAVAQVSALEAAMVRAAPHAEGRLRAVADVGALNIAAAVYRSGL